MTAIPLDAIPDLSDVQVIVFTKLPGQAPQVVEDQVTYPLSSRMLSVPFAKDVRGYSFFGLSFVYIIFEDGTDLYWARSRVLEYLSSIQGCTYPRTRQGGARAGCHRRGLGLPVRPAIGAPQPAGAAQPAGLVPALRADERGGRVGGGQHRRPCQAVPGDGGSGEAPGLRHFPVASPARRSSAATTMWAAAWWRWRRPSSWCAGWATSAASRTWKTCPFM